MPKSSLDNWKCLKTVNTIIGKSSNSICDIIKFGEYHFEFSNWVLDAKAKGYYQVTADDSS